MEVEVMKFKKSIILLLLVPLLSTTVPAYEVRADDTDVVAQANNSNQFEVIDVSKEQIISHYAALNKVTLEEAEAHLFPTATYSFRSAQNDDEASYVMFRSTDGSSIRDVTLTRDVPGRVGQVYFYCQVERSGWFRRIIRVIYAGYNSGNFVFNGQFQYHLADPNRIHYTLSGGLYSNTTYTVSGGGSIGLDEIANLDISVSGTSSYIKNLLYHGGVTY